MYITYCTRIISCESLLQCCDSGNGHNRTYPFETKEPLGRYCINTTFTSREGSFDGEKSFSAFLAIDLLPGGKLDSIMERISETYYISDDHSTYIRISSLAQFDKNTGRLLSKRQLRNFINIWAFSSLDVVICLPLLLYFPALYEDIQACIDVSGDHINTDIELTFIKRSLCVLRKFFLYD